MSQYYYNPFGNNSDVNEAMQREFYIKQRVKQEKHEIRMISLSMGCAIVAYLVVQTFVTGLVAAFGFIDLFNENSVFQYSFTVIGVSFMSVAVPFGIMALFNKKRYISPVIPNKRIKASGIFAWVSFGMLCCCVCQIAVSFIVLFFKNVLGLELKSGSISEPDSIFACVMNMIALAVIPAICEEFAMRCCSLQLLKRYGKGFAVVAVSIVFGLLHGNVVQFIFAFAVGLILGFVTVKTDSIVPAVLIHAFNNAMSSIQSILKYASGDKISDNAVTVIYIVWMALGVFSAIYLFIKKEFVKKPKENDSVLTTTQKFTAFLFPCMIIPFAILIVMTAMTVVKV